MKQLVDNLHDEIKKTLVTTQADMINLHAAVIVGEVLSVLREKGLISDMDYVDAMEQKHKKIY